MNKKNIVISIFILFSVQLLFVNIISFGSAADVVSTPTGDITTDFWSSKADLSGSNLKYTVNTASFGSLRFQPGVVNLVQFDNLGSEQTADGYTKVKGKAYFDFTMNFYTLVSVDEVYPSKAQVPVGGVFCTIQKCTSPSNTGSYQPKQEYRYAYTKWSLGAMSNFGFDGNVPITFNLADLTPDQLDFGGTKINVNTKSFVGVISDSYVMKSSYSTLAEYNTNYNQQISTSTLTVTDRTSDPVPSIPVSGTSDVISMDLGLKDGAQSSYTAKQFVVDYPSVGQQVQGGFHLTLSPQVKVKEQQLNLYKRDYVLIDVQKDWWDTTSGIISGKSTSLFIDSTSHKRTIGYEVQNYAVSVTVRVTADIYALLEVKPTVEHIELEGPTGKLGDYEYDNDATTDGGDTEITDSPVVAWWNANWWWIALVVFAVIFVVLMVYTPLGGMILPKIKTKFNK